MKTPGEAWTLLGDRLAPLAPASVPRGEALGRILAADVLATVDMPQADVSAMDGYALAGEVAAGTPLAVAGTVAAGDAPGLELRPGEVCKIMTGAVVPRGADRVIPVEDTDGGGERVVLRHVPEAWSHVRRQGEVVARGSTILAAGTRLTAGGVSFLASHGHARVDVHRPPRVAVMSTGDEVVPPDREPGPGQLRDSNSAFLIAAGKTLGLDFRSLGIAPDDPGALRERVAAGLADDVLLLCGGVSMGEFDFVESVLGALGCEVLFDAVAIQPGKPLVAARHAGGWVFGLPGNPASVMVTFWLFVRPLLRVLMGHRDGTWHGALAAVLAGLLPAAKGRDRFLPAAIAFRDGVLHARPHPPCGSHDVLAYARGSALVRVPAHSPPAAAGEPCEVLPLVDWLEPAAP